MAEFILKMADATCYVFILLPRDIGYCWLKTTEQQQTLTFEKQEWTNVLYLYLIIDLKTII